MLDALNNLDKLFTTDTWFWIILNNFTYFIKCIIFYYLINYMYEKKYSKLVSIINFLILDKLLFNIRFSPLSDFSIILSPIIGYIYCKINYYIDNNKKAFIICLIYWALIQFIIASLSYDLMFPADIIHYNSYMYYIQSNLIMMLLLIIGFVLAKYCINRKKYKDKNLRLIFIPISVNLISLLIVFDIIRKNTNGKDISELVDSKNLTMILIAVLVVISTIYISYVFDKIVKSHKIEIENNIIKKSINKDYNHYLSLKEQQLKVRKLHHDMKNHIICIKELYKNDSENLDLYINEIDHMIMDYKEAFETNNSILDIIVNDKYNTCLKENIDFKCSLDFSKCEFIDMVDVCTIFSNCLDNCIEACRKISDESTHKYIDIKNTYMNNMCVVKIENSKINDVIIKNKILHTDKNDKFLHGIGIKNIKESVEKYNGQVNFESYNNKFVVKIIIPIKD